MPSAIRNGAKEAREETLKDMSFVMVGGAGDPIHHKGGDGVAAKAAVGGGVKFFCILIPFKRILDLCPGLPIDGTFLNGEMESVHSKGPKGVFREGKGA
jgi:hypothetical protein